MSNRVRINLPDRASIVVPSIRDIATIFELPSTPSQILKFVGMSGNKIPPLSDKTLSKEFITKSSCNKLEEYIYSVLGVVPDEQKGFEQVLDHRLETYLGLPYSNCFEWECLLAGFRINRNISQNYTFEEIIIRNFIEPRCQLEKIFLKSLVEIDDNSNQWGLALVQLKKHSLIDKALLNDVQDVLETNRSKEIDATKLLMFFLWLRIEPVFRFLAHLEHEYMSFVGLDIDYSLIKELLPEYIDNELIPSSSKFFKRLSSAATEHDGKLSYNDLAKYIPGNSDDQDKQRTLDRWKQRSKPVRPCDETFKAFLANIAGDKDYEPMFIQFRFSYGFNTFHDELVNYAKGAINQYKMPASLENNDLIHSILAKIYGCWDSYYRESRQEK